MSLLALINCARVSNDIKYDFDKETLLVRTDSINLEDIGILNPVYLSITDSFFVIQNRGTEENLSIINKKDLTIINTAKKGNGPNEIVQFIPVENNRNNVITFADRAQKKLYSIRSEGENKILINEISFKDETPRFFSLNELNDSIFIFTGMLSEGRFGIYNTTNNSIRYTADYPQNDESKHLKFPHIAALYSGTQIGINTNGYSFAAIYNGLLDIYNMDANGVIQKTKSVHYHYPKFNILENGPIIGNSKETKEGFRSITCDSTYIYLLYSGKSMREYDVEAFNGNEIYVYNWQGDPVKSYVTDSDLMSICVNNGIMWGLEKNGVYLYTYLIE